MTSLPIAFLSVGLFADPTAQVDWEAIGELVAQGRGPEALTVIESLRSTNPPDWELEILHVRALILSGQTDPALGRLLALGNHFPSETGFHLSRAETFRALGRDDLALEVLKTQQARDPENPQVSELMGDVHASLASSAYGKAFQADPSARSVRAKLAGMAALKRVTTEGGARPLDRAETRLLRSQVVRVLQSWAEAWTSRNAQNFRNHYWLVAPDAEQPDGSRRLLAEIAMEFVDPLQAVVNLVEIRRFEERDEKLYKRLWLTYRDGRWGINDEKILAP